jgi:hypothetical protein
MQLYLGANMSAAGTETRQVHTLTSGTIDRMETMRRIWSVDTKPRWTVRARTSEDNGLRFLREEVDNPLGNYL